MTVKYYIISVLGLNLGYTVKYNPLPSVVGNFFRQRVMFYVCILIRIHSQLLNIIILKFKSPVLLNLLGNIFRYCPAVGAVQRINPSNIDLPRKVNVGVVFDIVCIVT